MNDSKAVDFRISRLVSGGTVRSIALLLMLWVLAGSGSAEPKWIYSDGVTTTFEPNDEASAKQGVKKCELSITPVKLQGAPIIPLL